MDASVMEGWHLSAYYQANSIAAECDCALGSGRTAEYGYVLKGDCTLAASGDL